MQSTYKVHVLIAHLEFMWQAASPDSRIISSSYSFGNVARVCVSNENNSQVQQYVVKANGKGGAGEEEVGGEGFSH